MAIKINFDITHNPEMPTIVLAKRNGDKIGQINAKSIEVSDSMNDGSDITFNVYKYDNGIKCDLWEQITNFKLIHCVEWDMWFEISVEVDESTDTVKTVFCKRLGVAELSQIMIYNIEINTENDIARDDYVMPTVLYNNEHPEASLLHRITEKAPHYTIIHVDDTIKKIQRMFSFDDISIYDAFQKITEEIDCLFILHSNSDENGNIQRTISVYDLDSNCNACNYRGEFTEVCPQCGSKSIYEGYGEDTTIFITSDELADNIQLTTDTDSIKNCFKLEAGDDLMTATIRNCNPNGTDYLWYFSDSVKTDMSPKLSGKLKEYDDLYVMYQTKYEAKLNEGLITYYNNLVNKYREYNNKLESIKSPIIGHASLMNGYYNAIDLEIYLQSTLMPTVTMSDTNAKNEAAKLTVKNLSPISVTDIKNISVNTAENAVTAMAKVVVDSRYKIQVESSSLDSNKKIWTGNFSVTNYSDEEDTWTSETISITINDNYELFVKQKLEKALKQDDNKDFSISGLFKLQQADFASELKKYSLDCLNSFHNSCQSCIDILIEQGVGNSTTWSGKTPNLYNDLYVVYLNKMSALATEISLRQQEISYINDLKDCIIDVNNYIQASLNFQNFLGSELWLEFCTFRREDKYSNSNYISDGLNNAELFEKANEFINVAKNEIYKSSELQHSISTTLKNLLVIDKFEPLIKYFVVGNWLRIMIDDELYKLRLVKYSINYNDINKITVDFSDVIKANTTLKSIQDVVSQATSMATSYSSVQRQAQQGEKGNNTIKNWVKNGLDTTTTKIVSGADHQTQIWDEHGMIFKKYDSINDKYDNTQLKIINSTIAITNDNWQTVKTAVGEYYYFDPFSETPDKPIRAYGVNAEAIVGKLIIGESLNIYNDSGTLKFDNNGLYVANNKNKVIINPNSDSIFKITNNDESILSFDEDGNLIIVGNIIAKDLTLSDNIKIDYDKIRDKPELASIALSGKYDDLDGKPELSQVAISGDFADLKNAPNMALYIHTDGIIGTTPTQGSTGFLISKEGLLQASNAIIYGTLYSSNGKIGGWTIGNNSFYNNTSSMDSTTIGTYIGIDGIRQYAGNNAYVDIKNGIIKAVGGDFTGGKITSSVIQGGSISIANSKNTVDINPNNNSILNIKKDNADVLSFDENGNLVIMGNIIASSLTLMDGVEIDFSKIDGLDAFSDVAFSGKYDDLSNKPDLSKYLTSASLSAYIQKDGIIGSKPSEGSTGFTVSKDGLLQASNAIIYGTLYSSVGKIGGWTIGNNSLYNGTTSIDSTIAGTYIGVDGIRNFKNANSYVNIKNGVIKAVGGDFSGGKITSSVIEGGSISIGDNFNVDTDGNVIGSSFIISANGKYVPSQYVQLKDTGLILHTHYTDSSSGVTYDVGNICLSTNYADTTIYMSDTFVDTDDLTNADNNWKIVINASGSITASQLIEAPQLKGTTITGTTIKGTTINGTTAVMSGNMTSNTLLVNGNANLCKTGGTVYVYPQDSTDAGGEIRLVDAGITTWTALTQSVNIDNYKDNFRVYMYDSSGTYHAMTYTRSGTLSVEALTVGGVSIKSNTLTTAGMSCYFTYNDEEPARHFRPPNTGLVRLGTPNYRWSEVWCTLSSINSTSDERLKYIDGEIDKSEELIRAIHPIQYRFKDGDSGRTHYGFGSQTFKDDLINVGLNPNQIAAFLCDVTEEAKENGVTLESATEDEKIYGLRYGELIAPLVSVVQKLLNRVDELEKLLK